MAITPKPPFNTPVRDKAIEDKVDDAHENKAEAKVAEKKEVAKADIPTGYAAVNGSMKVVSTQEDDKSTPNGTMLYPITENTGPALPGYSWSGEKYYPPAP